MNTKEIRLKNLNGLIEKHGNQKKLSDLIDIDSSYLSQLKNPSNPKNIGENMARKIEAALGLQKGWMDNQNNTNMRTGEAKSQNHAHANVEDGPDITGRIPLISWVQAGEWQEIIDNFLPGEAEEWRLTTAKVSKNAFSLRVKGDSMTNPHGAPSIPEGSVVVIDPNVQYNNKSIVVARLEDSMEATLKMLIIDGNQKFLKPLNPIYPLIPINGNCHIVGTAVRVEFDL